ncbi:hypothetical protein HGO21_03540 [Acinetobacter sp. CUI P1]|nr:hypothetical protein [Acinetobacter sp. CUI P1]
MPTSRNQLVELAIQEYVEAAALVLWREQKLNIDELLVPAPKTEPTLEEQQTSSILLIP